MYIYIYIHTYIYIYIYIYLYICVCVCRSTDRSVYESSCIWQWDVNSVPPPVAVTNIYFACLATYLPSYSITARLHEVTHCDINYPATSVANQKEICDHRSAGPKRKWSWIPGHLPLRPQHHFQNNPHKTPTTAAYSASRALGPQPYQHSFLIKPTKYQHSLSGAVSGYHVRTEKPCRTNEISSFLQRDHPWCHGAYDLLFKKSHGSRTRL